jgi:hypothetical protein
MPRSMFFIGIATPIRPVEQTRTASAVILFERPTKLGGLKPSSFSANWEVREDAASCVIRSASVIPCGPVHAFAFPEFTTIARPDFFVARWRLIFTGAAQT